MKTNRLIACALAVVMIAVVTVVGADQPLAVDRTPVLRIGDFTVSRYLFEKAYNQFIASGTRRTGEKPDPAEVARWFRLYLAQQVLKADLVEQKQLDRPDVVAITGRMARYMLTQSRGPLYRSLGGPDSNPFPQGRRARILKECQFSALPQNIARLWAAIGPGFSQGRAPLEADVADMGSVVVAAYVFNGERREISASDFVRDFQQGIARMGPRDVNSLGGQIEDIAVAEHDLAEAKRLRLDQTPQFLEDRHNFALNQVLALHEKEVLAPQLAATTTEMRTYYEANLPRYTSPLQVVGALCLFLDPKQALKSVSLAVAETDGTAAGPDKVIDPFVLRRDDPPLLVELPYAFLASAPSGRRYGPFPSGDQHAVFLKHRVGDSAPRPFDQVREEIQQQLRREKLEAWELEYLTRNAGRVKFLVDFARYGLEPAAVVPPEASQP